MISLLPIKTISENNMREHWAARHRRRRDQRQTVNIVVGVQLRMAKVRPPCVVTLTRVAPRALDGDNLQGALKAVRDGVADALGIDDGDDRVRWHYDQRKGEPNQYAVEIRAERSA